MPMTDRTRGAGEGEAGGGGGGGGTFANTGCWTAGCAAGAPGGAAIGGGDGGGWATAGVAGSACTATGAAAGGGGEALLEGYSNVGPPAAAPNSPPWVSTCPPWPATPDHGIAAIAKATTAKLLQWDGRPIAKRCIAEVPKAAECEREQQTNARPSTQRNVGAQSAAK